MKYLVKTPGLVSRWIYPGYIWKMPEGPNKIYLTFDDGPHPDITPFVLDQLKAYGAKATFFCVGKNIDSYPGVFKRIIADGHSIGNHTYNHLNGWKASDADYFNDVTRAGKLIDSSLFRPPYGRITRFQAKQLKDQLQYRIMMWTVLSGDFDKNITPEICIRNVTKNVSDGSIVVFHDSEKANDRMKYALPAALDRLSGLGFGFDRII